MNKPFALTPTLAATLAVKMAEIAAAHANDQLANQYARTSEKLEVFGQSFAEPLSKMDILTVQVFIKNYMA